MARYKCGDCRHYSRCEYTYQGSFDCALYESTAPTVFDQITASPYVLAEKFIYVRYTHYGTKYYMSTIVDGEWYNKEEAFAATVAKLKEVR